MMLTVKLRLTAVSDAQHGGFATGWSPVYWGSIDDLFVNLTMPPRSLVVDVVNIVERRAAPANHQGVRFSVATNGKFTVATNREYGGDSP